jgi:hypothetical protein
MNHLETTEYIGNMILNNHFAMASLAMGLVILLGWIYWKDMQ